VFDSRQVLEFFLFSIAFRAALGPTQPPIQCVPEVLSPEAKRPGREADHLPPSSAEVKNVWSYASTPPYVFMALCLIKHMTSLHTVVYTLAFTFVADRYQTKR
jgi:hypothetical protein